MSNLPNNIDTFQRITDKTHQENVHKELHNDLADTLENVQKFSGAHHVTALPETSEIGHVYTLLQSDGEYQPGIYVCVAPDPVYLPLASRGEGYVKEFSFTNEKNISINHGLGSRGVFVKLFDASYNEIEYDEYQIVDENNVLIKLTNNTTGKVIMLAGGKDGMPPAHEWDGTRIRFKNPNGSWGAWVDLIAEIENKGDKGDTGPMPEHEWNGTSIRFKINEDTWGEWVDLRGPQGLPGVGIPGEPGADGSDGLSVIWRGIYSAAASYAVNDMVFFNGSSYICKLATTGNAPTNTTYWDMNASKGADGSSGGTSRLELVAGEAIPCTGYLPASFSGTGFESIKVGADVAKLKTYSSKNLLGVQFYMRKVGTPIGAVTIELYLATGGVPSGEPIETVTFDASEVGVEFALENFLFTSLLEANDQYQFLFSSAAGDESNYIDVIVEDYVEVMPQATPVYVGTDGRVYVSQDSGARKKVDGFVDVPAASLDLVMVTVGGVQSNFNQLLPGIEYYLSTSLGQLTDEVRDIKVGKALTSSSLLIQEEEIKVIPNRMIEKTSDGIGVLTPTVFKQSASVLIGATPSPVLDFVGPIMPPTTPTIQQLLNSNTYNIYNLYRCGQSFTVDSNRFLRGASFYFYRTNNPTDAITARLYSCVAGLPVTELASAQLNAATIINSAWDTFDFGGVELLEGGQYAIMIDLPQGTGSNYISVNYQSSNVYAGGSALTSSNGGVSFSALTGDLSFKLYLDDSEKKARLGFAIDGVASDNLDLGLSCGLEKTLLSASNGGGSMNIYGTDYIAGQIIQTTYNFLLTGAWFNLRKSGSPTGNLNLDIYEVDQNNVPFGPSLASGSIVSSTLSTGSTMTKIPVTCLIEKNKKYALVMSAPTLDGSNYVIADYYNSGSQYADGGRLTYVNVGSMLFYSYDIYDLKFQIDGMLLNFGNLSDIASMLQSAIRGVTSRKEKVRFNSVFEIESSIKNKTSVVNKLSSPLSGIDVSGNGGDLLLNLADNATILESYGDENTVMIQDEDGNEQSSFINIYAGENIAVNNTPVPVYIETEDIINEAAADVFVNRNYGGTMNLGAYSSYYAEICQPLDSGRFNALKNIKVKLKKVSSPTGSMYAKLYTLDANNYPSTLLATSAALDVSTLTLNFVEKTFSFSNVNAPRNTRLGIVLDCSSAGSNGNYVQVVVADSQNDTLPYKVTRKQYGGSWGVDGTYYMNCTISYASEVTDSSERISGRIYASYGESHDYKNNYDGLLIASCSKNDEVKIFVDKIKNLSDLIPGKDYFINNFFIESQSLYQGMTNPANLDYKKGQLFTASSSDTLLNRVILQLRKSTSSTFTDNLIARVYLADSNGLPTGSQLGYASISANITYNSTLPYTFTFVDNVVLTPGAKYVLTLEHEGNSNNLQWYGDTGVGNSVNWNGSAWVNVLNLNLSIKLYTNNTENIGIVGGDLKMKCGQSINEKTLLVRKSSGEIIKTIVPALVDAQSVVTKIPANTKSVIFSFLTNIYGSANSPRIELRLTKGETKSSGASSTMSITYNANDTITISGSYNASGIIIPGSQKLYCLN